MCLHEVVTIICDDIEMFSGNLSQSSISEIFLNNQDLERVECVERHVKDRYDASIASRKGIKRKNFRFYSSLIASFTIMRSS